MTTTRIRRCFAGNALNAKLGDNRLQVRRCAGQLNSGRLRPETARKVQGELAKFKGDVTRLEVELGEHDSACDQCRLVKR